MSVTFGFFNAQQVNGDYDRKYGADELAEYFASLIGNGISADIENCFRISAVSGMQISIAAGYAWINGYWIKSDAAVVKTLAIAPSSNSRIDSVVLRFSKESRSIEIAIVQGDVSSTPVFKSLTRTDDIYELMLGYVTISAGISAITSSMITDTRSNETYCGIISTFSQKAIPDGSVGTAKLANKSVTGEKVADALFSMLYTSNLAVANWQGSSAPYYYSLNLQGILADDNPIISLLPSSTYSNVEAQLENFGYIYTAWAEENKITFYATDKPSVALPIKILCIRMKKVVS